MSASSHLVEGGGGPTVHEPDAAVAQNVVAADGAAGQVAGVAAGHHAERPGPGGSAGEGAGWPQQLPVCLQQLIPQLSR